MPGAVGPAVRPRTPGLLRDAAVGVAALLLLAVAFSYALPRLVQQGAQAALAHWLGPGSAVAVSLGPPQPAEMLRGRFGPVRLAATGVRVGGLRLASLHVSARQLTVSLGPLVLGRRLVVSRAVGVRATAVVTQADLNAALQAHPPVPGVPVRFTLGQGSARAEAQVPLAGRTWPLAAEGHFVPDGRAGVSFVVDSVQVAGLQAPPAIRDRIVALLRPGLPRVDLSGLPLALAVTSVRIEPGRITLDAVGAGETGGPVGGGAGGGAAGAAGRVAAGGAGGGAAVGRVTAVGAGGATSPAALDGAAGTAGGVTGMVRTGTGATGGGPDGGASVAVPRNAGAEAGSGVAGSGIAGSGVAGSGISLRGPGGQAGRA